MPLLTLLTSDPAVQRAAHDPRDDAFVVASARSWDGLLRLIRERPATAVVLDSAALPRGLQEDQAVGDLRRRFPSVATVFIARPRVDPLSLFRLGRAGIRSLVLLPADALSAEGLSAAVWRALAGSTDAMVARAVSPHVPAREVGVVRLALEAVQRGWSTDELSSMCGLTRAHASVRLKSWGLPSVGHILTWAKLLHAGAWLTDPGRSAQSVARQLEYSSGASFRRALRSYGGMTPTVVRERGGLVPILRGFLDACRLPYSVQRGRSVA